MNGAIARASRIGGVLPWSGQAPLMNQTAIANVPDSYSEIMGWPICLGQNDKYADCLVVMAENVGLNAWARKGVRWAVDNAEPFEIFEALGGLPANTGLDPEAVFAYWRARPICGHKLVGVTSIALYDFRGMRESVIDTGSLGLTAWLTAAQLTQTTWVPTPALPKIGNHAFAARGYSGPYFHDETWGEPIPMQTDFVEVQGINAWRFELEEA